MLQRGEYPESTKDHDSGEDPVVCIFCRAPVPGDTKTRLGATIGADAAAAVSAAMLLDIAGSLRAGGLDVRAAAADPRDVGAIAALLPEVDVFPQPDGDLGQRMSAVLGHLTDSGGAAAIVGSDAVLARPELVRSAGDALGRGADAAVCPAPDGGYSLIAARGPVPALFRGVAWGSGGVLADTLSRAADAGIRIELLDTLDDVDVLEDLAHLSRGADRGPVAVRTRHLVSSLSIQAGP